MEHLKQDLSYQPIKTSMKTSEPYSTYATQKQSAMYAIFTELTRAWQKLMCVGVYTPTAKRQNWKSCNPTIEDYNRSRTPSQLPPSNHTISDFKLNEELYYRIKEYHKRNGIVSPDVIFRQLQRTNLTCRTTIA